MITVIRITPDDDLQALVNQINKGAWDADNDITPYDVESLKLFLQSQDTVFVVAYEGSESEKKFLGMASGRLEIKPYEKQRWLYVDEVDVCADLRKKGAGKAMMQKLLQIADEADCEELWLGTEVDNDAANALYTSLNPNEKEQFVGYSYWMEED